MSLWMFGEILEWESSFFACDYIFELYSKDNGDEVDGVNYRKGGSEIVQALWLWELFDSERRAKLLGFINDEIRSERNYDDKRGYLISVPNIRRYLAMLDDVDKMAESITDEKGFVLAAKRDYAQEKLAFIGEQYEFLKSPDDGERNEEYYLAERIATAKTVKQFLEIAVRLNREVWLD